MADYKHGAYAVFSGSIGATASSGGTIAVYVGVAPINLVRGFAKSVNTPIKLSNFQAAMSNFGYSENWEDFDLCEAFKVHFDNPLGNVGPIVAINVLDPAIHKKTQVTTTSLSFVNGRATINSDTIILDTLVLENKVEGIDFSIDYDYTKKQVIIQSIGDTVITGAVEATYNEVDASMIEAEDIIGGVTASGVYTGLGCVSLVYPQLNMIPNLILCPGWSSTPAVYAAMVTAGSKINGHWEAFVYADIPVADADTRDEAKTWQTTNGYTNERSKVFYPMYKGTDGKVYHLSVAAAWRTMLTDDSNGGIPMESPSNKAIGARSQYFGEGSTNRGFDKQQANELNAVGITTVVFWGGQWVLWGPHTAAYKHGAVVDNRSIFDNSIRLMMYVSNSFQQDHALTIDSPMTVAIKDTIREFEQSKMDALAAVGAFIGEPVVEFLEGDNSTDDLVEGNFVWSFKGTPTPPFKSGTLKVAYTTAGFDSYIGEE